MRRTAVAIALLGALLAGVPAQAAPGGLAGVGSASSATCEGVLVLVGIGVDGVDWIFSAHVVSVPGGTCIVNVASATANGPWNPASGGCVPPAPGSGMICVGAVGDRGEPTTVPVTMCPTTGGCYNGAATVIRV